MPGTEDALEGVKTMTLHGEEPRASQNQESRS
jgi:hypothetical protein